MIIIKKIDLVANREDVEEILYATNHLEMALISHLEQQINHNFNTWTYNTSKFVNMSFMKAENSMHKYVVSIVDPGVFSWTWIDYRKVHI